MARKERETTIKVIENKNVYDKLLTEFFAKKYEEKYINKEEQKS